MKKYKFKPGFEDAQIPFAYVKGGILNAENCTDEHVDVIKNKFPQFAHNFVEADYEETEFKSETTVTNLAELKVPELKKLAAEKGLAFEANISKPELIELLSK